VDFWSAHLGGFLKNVSFYVVNTDVIGTVLATQNVNKPWLIYFIHFSPSTSLRAIAFGNGGEAGILQAGKAKRNPAVFLRENPIPPLP
jgi:hypothetical protein